MIAIPSRQLRPVKETEKKKPGSASKYDIYEQLYEEHRKFPFKFCCL